MRGISPAALRLDRMIAQPALIRSLSSSATGGAKGAGGEEKPPSPVPKNDREGETKGAMGEFLSETVKPASTGSMWAKMRGDLSKSMPPPVPTRPAYVPQGRGPGDFGGRGGRGRGPSQGRGGFEGRGGSEGRGRGGGGRGRGDFRPMAGGRGGGGGGDRPQQSSFNAGPADTEDEVAGNPRRIGTQDKRNFRRSYGGDDSAGRGRGGRGAPGSAGGRGGRGRGRGGAEDGEYGVAGGEGGGRRTRRGGDDVLQEESSSSFSVTIPPQIEAMLFDQDTMDKKFAQGFSLETEGMDEADAWLAQNYEMSSKSAEGVALTAWDSDARRRVQLPQPRSLHQLLQHLEPRIDSVDPSASAAARVGHALGEDVWNVLSDNLYYSDADKQYMANIAAKLATKHYTEADKLSKEAAAVVAAKGGDLYHGMEMIFTREFKKGKAGIDDEKRRRAAADFVVPDDYKQGATDWKQQAVIDEDQL